MHLNFWFQNWSSSEYIEKFFHKNNHSKYWLRVSSVRMPLNRTWDEDSGASSLLRNDPRKLKWGSGDSGTTAGEKSIDGAFVELINAVVNWGKSWCGPSGMHIDHTSNYPSKLGNETFIHGLLSPTGRALNLCTPWLSPLWKRPWRTKAEIQ